MPNNEDYLDGLLDSISEAKSSARQTEKRSRRSREERVSRRTGFSSNDDFLSANGLDHYRPRRMEHANLRRAFSESDFLNEFENELLTEDASKFLEEFEKELFADEGVDVPKDRHQSDAADDFAPKTQTAPSEPDDFLAQNPIDAEYVDNISEQEPLTEDLPTKDDSTQEADASGLQQEETQTSEEDDLMAGLGSILEDSGEPKEEEQTKDVSIEEEPEPKEAEVNQAEDDAQDLMEGLGSILEDVEEPKEEVPTEEVPTQETVPEADAAAEPVLQDEFAPDELDEAITAQEGDVVPTEGDDELDLEKLLAEADAADEGGEAPAESAAAPAASKAAPQTDEEEEEEPKGGIAGIIAKIMGIFKKKKGDDEEGEAEDGDGIDDVLSEALADGEGGEPPKDKKQLKKEAKEAAKKEKEAAKKAAAKEKEAAKKAKKDKPPKEKKPKAPKEPDTSPKTPIPIVALFVFFAFSIVVFVFLGQKLISYRSMISSAQSAYDSGDYIRAYEAISGVEVKEDDAMLYARIEVNASLASRYHNYELAIERGDYLSGLDNLIRGAGYFAEHQVEANDLDMTSGFHDTGLRIQSQLTEVFNLTNEEALEVYNLRTRKEYTRALYAILEELGLWERGRR